MPALKRIPFRFEPVVDAARSRRPPAPSVSRESSGPASVPSPLAAGVGLLAIPWAASAVIHVGVLCVLAGGIHEAATSRPPESLQSWTDDGGASDDPGSLSLDVSLALAATPSSGSSSDAGAIDAVALIERAAVTVDIEVDTLGGSVEGSGEGAGGTGSGDGQGKGQGSGRGDGSVAFFGTAGAGQRFIFLIDCSTSMSGERFARARHELIRTLQSLGEEQEFYVIFFSDRTFPLYAPHPAEGLVKATKLHKNKSRRWISNRVVVGGTVPDEALRMALGMKPDVIYLLSDGDFAPSAREAAKRANTNETVIHTIGFGFKAGETQLKAIAEDNKGRYRFVP